MLHMRYICYMSGYYGLIKPLYHIKCIRTVIKGIKLARVNALSAIRIRCTPPKPQSEFGAPPKHESEFCAHTPKPQSEFSAPPLNLSQNPVHPPPENTLPPPLPASWGRGVFRILSENRINAPIIVEHSLTSERP